MVPALKLQFTDLSTPNLMVNTIATSISNSFHDYKLLDTITLDAPSKGYIDLLSAIYFAGAVWMLLQSFYSVIKVMALKKNGSTKSLSSVKIIRTNISQPFSFFNLIFLPKHEIDPVIIEHEKVHVRQFHWIDLLLVEFAGIILWFNPLIMLYKRSIKIQHEYLADDCVINAEVHTEQYLNCMLQQIQLKNYDGLINHFYSKSIKQRILMITKNKTSIRFSVVYLLIIPVLCILMFAFANKPSAYLSFGMNDNHTSKNPFVIVVDAGHGGKDAGATSGVGLTEKDLTLSFAKKIKNLGEEKGISVILTRASDQSLSLQDRAIFANHSGAELFISLHVNYDQADPTKSGMQCILSEDNARFEDSKMLGNELMSELKTINGIAVNEIKNSDARILKSNKAAAVIIELGYLSNKADYAYISNENNQTMISAKIVSSVLKYLN
jgi:N-acetylmuramoyl-L-alanine amidase